MYPKLKHRLFLAFVGLIGLGVIGVSTRAAKQTTKVDPLILERSAVSKPLDLRHHLVIWHSKENASDLFKAVESFDHGEFSRLDSLMLRDSITDFTGNYWIRFEITNKDVPNDEWYLEFSDITATDINLYTLDHYRLVDEQEAAFETVGSLSISGTHPMAKAYIPMGKTRTFFAQLTSHQAPFLNIRMSNEPSLISNIFAEQSTRTNFSAVAVTLLFATLFATLLTRNLTLLFLIPIAGSAALLRESQENLLRLQEFFPYSGFIAAQWQNFLTNIWLFCMTIFLGWRAPESLISKRLKIAFFTVSTTVFVVILFFCLRGDQTQSFIPHLFNLTSVTSCLLMYHLSSKSHQITSYILFGTWFTFTVTQLCVTYAPGFYQPIAFSSEALAYTMIIVMVAVALHLADQTIDAHLKKQRKTLAFSSIHSHATIPSQANKAA